MTAAYKSSLRPTSALSLTSAMAQLIAKDLLIIGNSNIRRYLYRAGGAYSQACDCGIARNLTEFGNSLKMIESKNYRIVIFAMMTNIVIDTGSTNIVSHL